MSKSGIIASAAIAALMGGAIAAFAVVWRPAIEGIEPPPAQSFEPALVKRGRDLAAIGNCSDCHTVKGGKTFAGGLPVPTPFGTIYSSNITPDPDTGIGRWSEAAFQRAMRSGVDRAGKERLLDFFFRIFTGGIERSDIAVAEAGPRRGFRLQHATMKIHEAEAPAEFANVVVRLVISWQHPQPLAERRQSLAARLEAAAKRGQIACADVHISRLGDDPRECAKIAVNIAEDENLH